MEDYAELLGVPVHHLQRAGVSNYHWNGRSAVKIPVLRPDGTIAATRYRIAPSGDQFRWRKGDKPWPHIGWDPAHPPKEAVVVEGPSDWHILGYRGIAALGLPSNSWSPAFTELVAGIDRLLFVIEPEQSGEGMIRSLQAHATDIIDRVWLLRLDPFKDVRALHLAHPTTFSDEWQAARSRARHIQEELAARGDAELAEHRRQAADLLRAPDVLKHVERAIIAGGYAGDTRPALLVYLAFTSRLTRRPVNLAFVAQAASGKNYTIDAILALMPAEAYYMVSAASERALIYAGESFEHRVIVIREADSIPDRRSAASAIRAVADDNVMRYDTVEKDPQGQMVVRHIEKRGPTGLITTSTRSLAHQLGTRMLEVSLPDDPKRIRAILLATASRGPREKSPDVPALVALQRYLRASPVRQVDIPYADRLARQIPADVQRITRDFRKLLSMIKAHALLHQMQREHRDAQTILATIEDYIAVRRLLEPLFETISADGLTPAVRATVEEVGDDEEVSSAELCRRLNLSKATVSWRVTRALKGGWLINAEDRQGHPMRLKRGSALPEETSVLPSPESLTGADVESDSNIRTEFAEAAPARQDHRSTGGSDGREDSNGLSNREARAVLADFRQVAGPAVREFEGSNGDEANDICSRCGSDDGAWIEPGRWACSTCERTTMGPPAA